MSEPDTLDTAAIRARHDADASLCCDCDERQTCDERDLLDECDRLRAVVAHPADAWDEGWKASCDWHDEDMRRDFDDPMQCRVDPCDAVPEGTEDAVRVARNPYRSES